MKPQISVREVDVMESMEITEHISAVLGIQVSESSEDINAFRLSNPVFQAGRAPTHIVRPRDVSQLQELIRFANENDLNVTVASSTGRHCNGGFVSARDNLLVDLSPWKSIEWVNRRNRVCLIEPGVTYGELLEALEPHGLTVPMPLAPRSSKSVIASVMDRTPSTWPNKQWDISDPVASTEFIFGNGELFRTGAAGGPGTLEQQRAVGGAQKCPLGPSQTDFHRVIQGSQGTMGIVTWITMRTEVKPTLQTPFVLGTDSLEKLISFVYEVQRPGLGEHSFILDRTAAAMLMSADNGESFDAIRESLPSYICLQNIAGFECLPVERVKYQQEDIKEIARRHSIDATPSVGVVSAVDLLKTATRPAKEADWRHGLHGHCLSIFFLTTLDRTPALIETFSDLAKNSNLDPKHIGIYLQPVVQNHACHVEFMIPYAPDNHSEVDIMRRLERESVEQLAEAGAFFSRPYGSSAEIVFKQNPLNYEILKKVKEIFDPDSVLNTGEWGL